MPLVEPCMAWHVVTTLAVSVCNVDLAVASAHGLCRVHGVCVCVNNRHAAWPACSQSLLRGAHAKLVSVFMELVW